MTDPAPQKPASAAAGSTEGAGAVPGRPAGAAPGPLPKFRLRGDLISGTQEYGGRLCYVVKDPVTLTYFRFAPKEHRVLQQIKGRTIPEICAAVEQSGDERPSEQDIQQFLIQLLNSGLVVRDGVGDGRQLHARKQAMRRLKRKSLLGSLMYVKFPGFDPHNILNWLYPRLKWAFSPAGFFAAIALMLYAAGYTLVHFDEFVTRVRQQSLESFFSWWTLLWLWVALGVSKILHEFGHGLTCRHFGGECHEMGFLLLVFSPALYCDTTDAWTMPNKWHRIAIGAGGIYVELIIASVSTLVWWHTQAGTAHSIAFALMTLCSLSTFLVNANPLMRYDGYYILADLVEIPNLRPKAQAAMQSFVDRELLGLPTNAPPPTEGPRWFFLTYAVAAWAYGWFLAAMILWFFYNVLKPYRLSSVSVALASVVAFQMLLMPIWRNIMRLKFVSRNPGKFRWWRTLTTAVVLAALGYAAVVVPIPRRVWGALTVEGIGQTQVFVPVPGRIEEIAVAPGENVAAGALLARLSNPELDAQIEYLEHRLRSVQITADKFAVLQRPGEEQSQRALVTGIQEELASRREQRDRLTIRADAAGQVVPAPQAPERIAEMQGYRAPTGWQSQPLHPQNVGAHLEPGTLLCELRPSQKFEAVMLVEQSEIAFLKTGEPVLIKLDVLPDRTLTGTVSQIGRVEVEHPPEQLLITHGGELPVRSRADGRMGLPGSYYEVRIELTGFEGSKDDPNAVLRSGFRGRARVDCGRWTCWDVVVREFHKLFHL